MRVRSRWTVLAVVVLVVLGVVGTGAYPWEAESGRVAAELNSAIGPVAGLHWGRPGRVTFSLLPWPTLHVVDVELFDTKERSVLSAPSVEIGVWPAGLLRGEFAPMSAKLLNPTALIDLDAARDGAERIAARPTALLTRVEVQGGVAEIVSASLRLDTLIENVDGWLQWTKVSRPLGFSLAGLWRGEPVTLQGRLDAPLELREGRPSRATMTLKARPAELAFAGEWTPGVKSVFEGELSAQIHSLLAVDRWLGVSAPPPIATREIGLQGKAVGTLDALVLSEARLDVGGQRFDGSLDFFRNGAKSQVSGTLAADTLDVSALWGLPAPLLDSENRWSRQAVLGAPSDMLDLDISVSASHASWKGHQIEAAAASVLQRDGRLTISLLDATAWQGQLSGRLSIQGAPNGLQAQAALSLVNADFGAASSDWGVATYAGRGGCEATLRAVGGSPAELAASLSGSATFVLKDGSIDGVNFEQALRRSLRHPVDFERDMAIGQTNFSSAQARLEIVDGQARIVEARMEGPGAIVRVQGAIDIADREWRARIEATQASAMGEPSVDAARLTFGLFGPWGSPSLAPLASTE